MDTVCIEGLAEENQAAAVPVAAVIEGLQDYLRLNIESEARSKNSELLARYQSRNVLHEHVRQLAVSMNQAIEALLADGYPDEPTLAVSDAVLNDLDEQLRTLEVARDRFNPMPITTQGEFVEGEESAA